MLVNCVVATLFNIINFLMLGGAFSGTIVNLVALVQLIFALWHVLKETRITVYENVVFFIAYVVLGLMGYRNIIDVLPVLGAIAYMFSIFQRNEQKTRVIILINAGIWLVYDMIVGSSAVFAQLATIGTTCIALYRYRNHKTYQTEETV